MAMSGQNCRFFSLMLLTLWGLAGLSVTLSPRDALAADTRATIEVNGHSRNLRLVETVRLKKTPRTTIIVFHAGRGSVTRLQRSLGLDELARKSGAVLVYPGAIGGRWDVGKASDPITDDAQFVRAIITKLVADGVADNRKIYVAGVSSGGMLAMRLACEWTDLFAGAAAIIANLPADLASTCKPSKPLPFLLINGTGDPLVCSVPVELLRIEGGGHTIPGRRTPSSRGAAVGAQNNDIDSARVMVDFFKRAASGR
ncbi:MAG: hypothetical protein EBY21_04985 [Alphaproteobacteria bacterium]|nr:hypothetical protein [Alphaproteobacteria bacterium]